MKIGILVLFAFLLSLPSSSQAKTYYFYGPIYSNYKLSPERGGGCISGSVGISVADQRRLSILFVSEANVESTLKEADFGYVSSSPKKDISIRVSAFSMCLKPGRYVIRGLATNRVYSNSRVSVSFEVVAGKNLYIGSLMLQLRSEFTRCEVVVNDMHVAIRDEFDRDLAFIKQDRLVADLPVEKKLLDASSGAPYFVRCSWTTRD